MKLDELLNIISERTGNYVNQSSLAEGLGITRQTVSNRIKNDSEVTVSELQRLEEFFNVKFFEEISDFNKGIVYTDYYTDVFASCGNGTVVFSNDKVKMPLPIKLINGFSKQKKYSVINAEGNSMSPTIENEDKLIVEHWSGAQIQDNKIYVFCYGNEIFIKRLSKNLDEIIIKSDNPDYRVRTIRGNSCSELIVIGKVVGVYKCI